jgi:N-acetylmuramoyl-L-alanine amidase
MNRTLAATIAALLALGLVRADIAMPRVRTNLPTKAAPQAAAKAAAKPSASKATPSKTKERITIKAGGVIRQGGATGSEIFSHEQSSKGAGGSGASVELPSKAEPHAPWKIIPVGERHYVSSSQVAEFYQFPKHSVDGRNVFMRSERVELRAVVGSQILLLNGVKFVMNFPVISEGGQALFSRLDLGKLLDPVMRPKHINDGSQFSTVVVDAGHGGHDHGAAGPLGVEKDFALQLAKALKTELEAKGFRVLLTRSDDRFLTLSQRVAIANATPQSIFISLHFNAGSRTATGIETFALTPKDGAASLARGGGVNWKGLTGNAHDSANIALATAVHAQVVYGIGLVDRGIKRAQWSVLSGCQRPGILFEGGFVSSARDAAKIRDPQHQRLLAKFIALGVSHFRAAVGSRR